MKQIPAVRRLDWIGPPSSPPITHRRIDKSAKQHKEVIRNIITENPSLPAGTLYTFLGATWSLAYIEQITHGSPRPRKTLTELDPVTFPIAESAYYEFWAAVTLAKVSGRDVPTATIVIAVIAGGSPTTHPRSSATSPTIPVMIPISVSATKNAGAPAPI